MNSQSVLVIGGSGMIGAHICAHLKTQGWDVTVGSRRVDPSVEPELIHELPRLNGDYTAGGFTAEELRGFDSVVMSAGQDIRHIAQDEENEQFWDKAQRVSIPALAQRAKEAGVRRFVQIGSYYHQLLPELVEENAYVRARRDADDLTRALSDNKFAAITLNPPSIVGAATSRDVRRYEKMAAWLRGEKSNNAWAPAGGTNYMSVRSLAQAVAGALERGEGGQAYLIGDESLTFKEFFQRIVQASGGQVELPVRDEEHPLLPDRFIVQGRGKQINYEPDPEQVQLLGYDRFDVTRALTEIFQST